MKVLFLNPPFHYRFSREQRSPAVTKSNTLYYPKWLATAAGVAIGEGHDVHLLDAPADGFSTQYVLDYIEKVNIAAVICDTSTPSINNDLQVARAIKQRFANVNLMLVGRHVSTFGEKIVSDHPFVDAVAVREYEFTVRDWLSAVEVGADVEYVLGLWSKNRNGVFYSGDRAPIEDLDQLPFVTSVYKRFLNLNNYFYGHSLHPLVVFDTSRGCPYKCSFCAYPQTFSGHKMRYRSVENVADEFEFVAKELPQINTIMLEDDTFIVNKKRTLELAQTLIARGNKIPYDSNCRADIGADPMLLRSLRKSGARLFCVGFESGDPEVIRGMKKNLSSKKDADYHANAKKFVSECKSAGIMVHGCFMFGNLEDTPQSMRKTLEFAKELNPDTAQFFPIMVYPGTSAFDEAKEKGYLTSENPDDWLTADGLHNSVVDLPNVTKKQLVEFADRARREFYLRPTYIIAKIIQSAKSFDEFKRNVIGFYALIKYLVRGSRA